MDFPKMNTKMLDIIEQHKSFFERKYGSDLYLLFGPAHVIYDDYNLEDNYIENAIARCEMFIAFPHHPDRPSFMHDCDEKTSRRILTDTIYFLEMLLTIPENERYVYEEEDELS